MASIFERIIAGELPGDIVYRDEKVVAFKDLHPAAPVHLLIVPRKLIASTDDIEDSDEALIGHMIIVARDLARKQGVDRSGYRLVINCNADSGQQVYHLHVHLIGGRHLGPMVNLG